MNKLLLIFFLIQFVILNQLKADEWPRAKTTYYYSENKAYMLKVVPTNNSPNKNSLKFFSEHPEAKKDYLRVHAEKPGNRESEILDTVIKTCHGLLYKTSSTDTTLIWEKELVNKLSPVTAIVSNDGKSVLTFDDWLGIGYGNNVMVIYNEAGDLIKSYQLHDISPYPINDYDRSVSSINWNGPNWNYTNKYIDSERIEINFKNKKGNSISRIYNVRLLAFEK